SDALEEITHSLCTLEFEDHRPLYDWVLKNLETPCHPQQIEFARLNLTYTVMSKRKLLQLVEGNHVSGWDDPRMPTLAGYRRRGYTPEGIRELCERVGIAKANSTVDFAFVEFCQREDLNKRALRAMAVLDPLKVVIVDYPEGKEELLDADNNPEDENAGKRQIPFSRELYIERSDFMENPPKKFFRLSPGTEVRLKHAYYVTCTEVVKDESGKVIEVRCTHDPETRGGWFKDGRKVKGTLHWVSAAHAKPAEVRVFEHLFDKENPNKLADGDDFLSNLNPESLIVNTNALVEPSLVECDAGSHFQFLRLGYFCADIKDHSSEKPVFNRTVGLRDSWAKIQKKGK
ncbi:UNVERIFIED_CONTAM: hypothetical protein GTU68_060342, partial [Idotea baltica]|nr:hypothetical protein [Idotea baltica]